MLWKDLRDSLINGEVCKDILKQRNSVSQLSSVNRIVAYTNLGATLLHQHYLSARFRVRRPCQILSIQIQIILSASPSIAGIRQNRYQNRQLAGQTCCTNIGRMSEVERRQHVARRPHQQGCQQSEDSRQAISQEHQQLCAWHQIIIASLTKTSQ